MENFGPDRQNVCSELVLRQVVLFKKLVSFRDDVLDLGHLHAGKKKRVEWFEGGYGGQLFSRLSVQPVVNSQEHFLLMRVQGNIGSWVKQQFVQGNHGTIVFSKKNTIDKSV